MHCITGMTHLCLSIFLSFTPQDSSSRSLHWTNRKICFARLLPVLFSYISLVGYLVDRKRGKGQLNDGSYFADAEQDTPLFKTHKLNFSCHPPSFQGVYFSVSGCDVAVCILISY